VADRHDVVVAGGGVGGAALAVVLARAGLDVLVLERTTEYPDIVRGEVFMPWGVKEAMSLHLHEALIASGAHTIRTLVGYDPQVDREVSESETTDYGAFVPGVPGALSIRHPVICQTLADAASAAGAEIVRGASVAGIGPGASVSYRIDGAERCALGRLVVGADGRGSSVRAWSGIDEGKDPTVQYLGGILLDGATWWPDGVQGLATQGEVHVLVFPQGHGRTRVYAAFRQDTRKRFTGPDRQRLFLEALALDCLPGSDRFVDTDVAGPMHAYGTADTWTHRPFTEDVLLIGDAAGRNDPIIGQGLSITMRDVRIVSELMLGSRDWSPSLFEPYAVERAERMRRLRFAAKYYSAAFASFGPEGAERRARMRANPRLMIPLGAVLAGPEVMRAEAFTDEAMARLVA
jgi:2-polyprenyl-6-methoxyphenol hydroxylase-like FAD-dependent oxidoreductase